MSISDDGNYYTKNSKCIYTHLSLSLSLSLYIYIYIYKYRTLAEQLECSPMARETWVQYQRPKKWYLMPPCLTLSVIRYGSRVKWSNPGKGVAPFPTPWSSSYRKGSLRVTLDYGHQLYIYIYIYTHTHIYTTSTSDTHTHTYIYIYIHTHTEVCICVQKCVCVCVCV